MCAYATANIFWLFAIRKGSELARGAVLFSIGSALVGIFIGVIFYKEKVGRMELIGLCMGVVSIILLVLPDAK